MTQRKEPVKGGAAAKFPLVFTFPVSFCLGPSGGFRIQPFPFAVLPRRSQWHCKKTLSQRQPAPPWLQKLCPAGSQPDPGMGWQSTDGNALLLCVSAGEKGN